MSRARSLGVDLAPPCPSPKVPKVALGTSSPVCHPLHHDVPSTLTDPSGPLWPSAPPPSSSRSSLLFHFGPRFGHGSGTDGGGAAGLVAQRAGRWGGCPSPHLTRRLVVTVFARGRHAPHAIIVHCYYIYMVTWRSEALLGTPSACGEKKARRANCEVSRVRRDHRRLQGQWVEMRLLCRQASRTAQAEAQAVSMNRTFDRLSLQWRDAGR